MNAPQGILEGQYVTRPPCFNGQHYNQWKNRMENYIQANDYELWMIIMNGPYIPMKTTKEGKTVAKKPEEFDLRISRRWRKMLKLRSCCTLALDQMSKLVSQSVGP